MRERFTMENRGAAVMDEPAGRTEAPSASGILPETAADDVLQESAKLAEITRERRRQRRDDADAETVFELQDMSVTYSGSYAVQGVNMSIRKNEITALIGPSGCGKTTVLRSLNRTNDLIQGAKVHGNVLYHGIDLYGPKVEPVEVRRRIGMVFQKPNPFPKSIYDNIAFGPRVGGFKGNMDDLVERSLRRAALWDEVKHDLKASAMALSGGQQQRLCIARCIAVEPDVILMDEPCSALDPVSTLRIEELMDELVSEYTIVIVTHNMQQAARVSDRTGFFTVAEGQDEKDHRIGILVEFDLTPTVFTNPSDSRTEAYVTGRFG
jgi:phosphate transport system ATP-binding protein